MKLSDSAKTKCPNQRANATILSYPEPGTIIHVGSVLSVVGNCPPANNVKIPKVRNSRIGTYPEFVLSFHHYRR